MRTVDTKKISLKDRLSARLALVFGVAFLGMLALISMSGLFSMLVEGQSSAAEADVQTPPIVIDPKIETDLAKAMSFDAIPASTEVQNPFIDRAGIGGNTLLTTSAAPIATQASLKTPGAGSTNSTSQIAGPSGPVRSVSGIPGTTMGTVPTIDPGTATKMRFEDRLQRVMRGESTGPESEVFSVDDLVPVGFASGGDRGDEVILFSLSLCRTFSFPSGTRFFDGWLNSFDQREVVFAVQSGYRRKSYSNGNSCRGGAEGAAPSGVQ